MGKICQQCGKPIFGRARKWCETCKKEIHKFQMNEYYREHQNRWMMNGLYWEQQRHNKFGTGNLGSHGNIKDWKKEYEAIQKEFRNLKLRQQKKHWTYKP